MIKTIVPIIKSIIHWTLIIVTGLMIINVFVDIYTHLRHKNAGRGLIPNRVDIDQRPIIVEQKTRVGDFELDTIVGANHKGAIISIVDRCSKYAMLELVPQATKEAVREAIVRRLIPFKSNLHTLTSDNGKEFADHEKISKELGALFFFAKPYDV